MEFCGKKNKDFTACLKNYIYILLLHKYIKLLSGVQSYLPFTYLPTYSMVQSPS